ncbi:MAG: hypothetical protein J3Q66DRAFT_428634 [Benniella sp.]|nr:MAG: hypothetical protein J3Q66DRAFT_428634 [Benniella sp.]
MALSSLPNSLQDHDQSIHHSDDASDSSDEFASASEGEDELPWVPASEGSPVAARPEPQVTISLQEPSWDQSFEPTQDAFVPENEYSVQRQQQQHSMVDHEYGEQDHTQTYHHHDVLHQQRQEQQQQQQQQQQGHQHQQVRYEQHQGVHEIRHEPYWHHQQLQAQHVSAHNHSYVDNTTSSTQNTHFYTKVQSESHTYSYSYSQSQHQTQHHISSSAASSPQTTRSQYGSSPVSQRGATPRLRERMRQSPVLHSRIVQAYLDPNTSSTQQQQQHLTPDFIRQAWLQDHQDEEQQESSGDDFEEFETQAGDQKLPSYLIPIQAQRQPVVPVHSVVTQATYDELHTTNPVQLQRDVFQSSRSEMDFQQRQHMEQAEVSLDFNSSVDQEEQQWFDEGNRSHPGEGKTAIDQMVPSDEVETSWGFDDPLEAEESAMEAVMEAVMEPSVDSKQHDSRLHQVESSHIPPVIEDEADAWGYDDQLMDLVDTDTRDLPSGVAGSTVNGTQDSSLGIHDHESNEFHQSAIDSANPFASPEDLLVEMEQDLPVTAASTVMEHSYTETITEVTTSASIGIIEKHHSNEADAHSDISAPSHLPVDQAIVGASQSTYEVQIQPFSPDQRRTTATKVLSTDEDLDSVEAEAEASWGFDIEEAIDIETQFIEQRNAPPEQEDSEQVDTLRQQYQKSVITQESPEHITGPTGDQELFMEDASIRAIKDEHRVGQESDNEHDTEVREVLGAVHSNLFDDKAHGHPSGAASVVISSTTSSRNRTSIIMDGVDSTENSAITLQIKPDTLPEFVEADNLGSPGDEPDSISVVNDNRGVGSDSEGSETYNYLSTARTSMIGSSNRLNEILEDDDFLEHMERGVPMDRSISTPFSDDESPKFGVDDDVVESMERGEPWPADDVPIDPTETSIDNGDRSTSMELEQDEFTATSASGVVVPTSAIKSPSQDGSKVHMNDSHAVAMEDVVEEVSTSIVETVESTERPLISDDQDPANPFSDAAAIEDQDAWPVSGLPVHGHDLQVSENIDLAQERAESSDPVSQEIVQSTKTVSVESLKKFESIVDEDLEEDAWGDQELSIAVEPVQLDVRESVSESSFEVSSDVHTQITAQESQALVHDSSMDIENDLLDNDDNNAKADQDISMHDGTIRDVPLTDMDSGMEAAVVAESLESRENVSAHQTAIHVANVSTEHVILESVEPTGHKLDGALDLNIDDDAWAEQDDEMLVELSQKQTLSDVATVEGNLRDQEEHLMMETKEARSSFEMEATYSQSTSSHQESLSIDKLEVEDAAPFIAAHEGILTGREEPAQSLFLFVDEGNPMEKKDSRHKNCKMLQKEARAKAKMQYEQQKQQHQDFKSSLAPTTTIVDERFDVSSNNEHAHHHKAYTATTSSEAEADIHLKDTVEAALDQLDQLDAWDDQDLNIETESSALSMSQEANSVDVLRSHHNLVDVVYEAPASKPQSNLEPVIEAALDGDAWGVEDVADIDLVKSDRLETQPGTADGISEQDDIRQSISNAMAEVVTRTESKAEQRLNVDIVSAIDAALEDDAWDRQDDILSPVKEELGVTLTTGGFEKRVDIRGSLQTTEDKTSHMVDAAVEEDMWADQDLDIISTGVGLANTSDETRSTTTYETRSAETAHRKLDIQAEVVKSTEESIHSTVTPNLPQSDSTRMPSEELKIDFNLDEALEGDAWAEQDDILLSGEQPLASTVSHEPAFRKDVADAIQNPPTSQSVQHSTPSSHGLGSIVQQPPSVQMDDLNDDAWAWDDDEVDVDLKVQAEATASQDNRITASTVTSVPASREKEPVQQTFATKVVSTHVESKTIIAHEVSSHTVLPAIVATRTLDSLSPLTINKDHRVSGETSGEGDDSANQSPWQDVSPASGSKMSAGSEVESEFSVRSLDEYDHHLHSRDRSSGSVSSEPKRGMGSALSWTDIMHEEWHVETTEGTSGNETHRATSSGQMSVRDSAPKDNASSVVQDLPDLTGADSWDFEQDDDLGSVGSFSLADQSPKVSKADFSKSPRTSDTSKYRSSTALHESTTKATPTSPGRTLSSYQPSIAGSILSPPSQHKPQTSISISNPSTSESLSSAAVATEVEDDSHLPPAIRQQRARLAARGKPLPPVSKYTKDGPSSGKSSTVVSPQLSAVTSPLISFSSSIKSPVSPTSSLAPTADQKYLTPALQKQRERLEQKRAAAAAASAPRSAARRLTATESSSLDRALFQSQSQDRIITSPQLTHATISSGLHTMMSPTLTKKTAHVSESTETFSSPVLAPSAVEEFGFTSRRRGSSTSHGHLQQVTVPTSPLSEGVARRSRDGTRPKMVHAEETRETDVVRAESFRYVSRVSTSSSRSGWEDVTDMEEEGGREVQESGFGQRKSSISKEHTTTRTAGISSSSSSSFYQQVVPGLDDDNGDGESGSSGGFKASTTVSSTLETSSSTSTYLSNKKADDYDPYGPLASKSSKTKARDSMEDESGSSSFMEHQETLIGRSSPSVSYMSSTSGTGISHRHDHQHQHQQQQGSQHNASGGSAFFGGGGSGSLLGDITNIMNDKKMAGVGGLPHRDDDGKENKKPYVSQSSSSSNPPKSSSWSFGSWVSSAVAAATETIDKAYESLDPEYSKMKAHGGSGSDHTLSENDPGSMSPYKKPGYVVGGSSLALGLASIATNPSSPPSSPPPYRASFSEQSQQTQQSQNQQQQQYNSHSQQQSASPRLTRKHVSGRE